MSRSSGGSSPMGPAGLIVAVFLAGTLTGVAGGRWFDRGPAPEGASANVRSEARETPTFGPGSQGRRNSGGDFFLDQMTERLDLTGDQRANVDSILKAQREKSRQVMESLRPGLRASLDSMNSAIAGVLRPDQMEAWEDLLEEANSRRGGDFPGRDDRRRPRRNP